MIQNFRPGVIERVGLGYEAVHELNPRLVYGEVTGYGTSGPMALTSRAKTCWFNRYPAFPISMATRRNRPCPSALLSQI